MHAIEILFARGSAEGADHDATSASIAVGDGEPREFLVHLLERAVILEPSNTGQRRDGLLDLLGRDPAQTDAIVGAGLGL